MVRAGGIAGSFIQGLKLELFTLAHPPAVLGPADFFDAETTLTHSLGDHISIPLWITASDISIVIPVKDNQSGIDRFLARLTQVTKPEFYPREVIIVDNNSVIPIEISGSWPFPVVLECCERKGPAAARNIGISVAKSRWILFTDSDCLPTDCFVEGYVGASRSCIAFAGAIKLLGEDVLTAYYREQNIFIPMSLSSDHGVEPWTIITANCLILKEAIEVVGGFDERFKQAGGEDTDLGIKLRKIGMLRYHFHSISLHEIDDGLKGFANRFIRYGIGHKQLAEKYQNSIFELHAIGVFNSSEINKALARLHLNAMQWGYDGRSHANFPLGKYTKGFEKEFSLVMDKS